MADNEPERCQHWALPGTKVLRNGFYPCQDHCGLVLQYETHSYYMENTGIRSTFYLSYVRWFDETTLV